MGNWKIKVTSDGQDYWLQESQEEFIWSARKKVFDNGRTFFFLPGTHAQDSAVIFNDAQKNQALKLFPNYIAVPFTVIDNNSFVLLGGAGFFNKNDSEILGDIGSTIDVRNGFDSVTINGIDHHADATTAAEMLAYKNEYAALMALVTLPIAPDFSNTSPAPGDYATTDGTLTIGDGTTVTFDAGGDSTRKWRVKLGGGGLNFYFRMGKGAEIILKGGALAENIIFYNAGIATLGKNSIFIGNIFTNDGDINLLDNANVLGTLKTVTGKISFDNATIDFGTTTPQQHMGQSATYVLLTPAALTIGQANQPVSGNIGQLGAIVGGPVVFSGSGYSDFPAPASNQAVADAALFYIYLNNQTPTFTIVPGVPLESQNFGFGVGVYVPGVYNCIGAIGTNANGVITMKGAGVYIFQANGAMTTGANTVMVLANGATAANIFWATSAALTTGDQTIFKGTHVSPAGQTTGTNLHLKGRLLSTVAALTTGGGANDIVIP